MHTLTLGKRVSEGVGCTFGFQADWHLPVLDVLSVMDPLGHAQVSYLPQRNSKTEAEPQGDGGPHQRLAPLQERDFVSPLKPVVEAGRRARAWVLRLTHARFASRAAGVWWGRGVFTTQFHALGRGEETAGGEAFLKHLLTRRDTLPAAGPEGTGFPPLRLSFLAESVDPSQAQGHLAG